MDKHAKRFVILWAAVMLAAVVGLVCVFLHRDDQRLKHVKRQLGNQYDISFNDEGSLKDDSFYVRTSDGCSIYGTCNWYGKVTSETYVNIYYGQEYLQQIRDEIEPCFNECVLEIETDDISTLFLNEKLRIESDSFHSYEDYVAYAGQKDLINVNVYIRDTESMENVASALRILSATPHDFPVFIYAIPEEDFAIHQRISQGLFWTRSDIYNRDDLAWESKEVFSQFMYDAMSTYETEVGRYWPAYDECRITVDGKWVDVT